MSKKVLTLLEMRSVVTSYDSGIEELEIGCATFDPDDYLSLLRYPFASGKNLVEFLVLHKDDILNRADIDDPRTTKLEEQNFLDYLNMPWYLDTGGPKYMAPAEIFEFGRELGALTSKSIINYLLKPRGDYFYRICVNTYHQKDGGNTQESVQQPAAERPTPVPHSE
jgi:hypothetical protein